MGLAQTETGAKPSKDARTESRRATQRENEILQELRRSGGSSRIQNLADRLKVSEETIRRNLKSLARDGLVRRVHGGAHLPDARSEASFQQRVDENPDAKRRIAEKVAEIIEDGDSLFLDIGSTTSYIAQALQRRRDLFVVTNSVSVAHTLAARNGNRVFMAGGELRAHDGGAFGVEAIEFVRRFQVEYAVLSAAAINAASGFMLFDLQEAEFSREIMRRAKTSIVAADSSKFDHRAPISVDAPALVDVLVTDSAPPEELRAALSSWSVDVVLAD